MNEKEKATAKEKEKARARCATVMAAGCGLVLVGAWWVWPPAAMVLGGALLCAVAYKANQASKGTTP